MALDYNLSDWIWTQGGEDWGFDPRMSDELLPEIERTANAHFPYLLDDIEVVLQDHKWFYTQRCFVLLCQNRHRTILTFFGLSFSPVIVSKIFTFLVLCIILAVSVNIYFHLLMGIKMYRFNCNKNSQKCCW